VHSLDTADGRRRKFDVRALIVALKADHGLHSPSRQLVEGDAVTEPAEMRTDIWRIEVAKVSLKVFRALRHPDTEPKVIGRADDGNQDDATDEEIFVVYDAGIRGALNAPRSFPFWDTEIRIWPTKCDVWQGVVHLSASNALISHECRLTAEFSGGTLTF
jgi:hypothetical protein